MSINDEYKIINELVKLMPYVAHMRDILNIDPNELIFLRSFLVLYIFISLLSLSLLFALNNFHIFVCYFEKLYPNLESIGEENMNPVLLKTLSVLNYINENYNTEKKEYFENKNIDMHDELN